MAATVAPAMSLPSHSSAPVQHPYTCNTCQVAFKGSELQRSHMQSDWHRYNLKRRVASLPPLTSEVFAEKVLANQASAAATAARASFEKVCAVCQRTYFSENAYQNHLGSQKHSARLAQVQSGTASVTDDETASMMSSAFSLGEPIDTVQKPPVDDPVVQEAFSQVVDALKKTTIELEEPLSRRPTRPHHSAAEKRPEHPLSPITTGESAAADDAEMQEAADMTQKCLFCNLESLSLDANVAHMRSKHGLYIPEKEYLVDFKGLIGWLWDKIDTLHECLYCGQIKHTISGIQTHMRDKGHCMIAFESEADMVEVGQFYDFRSTYPDDEEEEYEEEDGKKGRKATKANGLKLGAKCSEQLLDENNEDMDSNEDGEWEDDEDDADGDMEVDGDEASNPASDRTARAARPSEGAFVDDYELHLPSGRTAGHRSLARYYRQNLHSYPTPAERQARLAITEGAGDRQESRDSAADGRGRQLVTRANGGLGLVTASESLRKQAQAKEIRQARKQQRVQNQYQWGVEKRANNQKHFRDPLLQ